jgi:hypothetical protein
MFKDGMAALNVMSAEFLERNVVGDNAFPNWLQPSFVMRWQVMAFRIIHLLLP